MDDSISDSQWICLNELKDIRFKYLENEQSLNLQVPPHMMTGYSVDLKGQQITSPQLLKIKPLNAAILNYSLYHTITNDENVFSGSAEGIFNSAIGNFSSGVLYNGNDENSYSHEKWVRLESKWQYVDPEKIRIYTLGTLSPIVRIGAAASALQAFNGRVPILNVAILSLRHCHNSPVQPHCLQHWIYTLTSKRFIQDLSRQALLILNSSRLFPEMRSHL